MGEKSREMMHTINPFSLPLCFSISYHSSAVPLTIASSLASHPTATLCSRFTRLSALPRATALSSSVTLSTAWDHVNQQFANGVATQWSRGEENVVRWATRRLRATTRWTFRRRFSCSTSEMSTIATSSEAIPALTLEKVINAHYHL